MVKNWNRMSARPANALFSAVYGAVLALLLGFGFFYVLGHLDVSNITSPGQKLERGFTGVYRAMLNLYAAHHATLAGSGRITGELGTERVSAIITLPITIWAVLPAIALIISGYVAGSLRSGSGRLGTLAPSVFGGALYAALLGALTGVVHAKLSPSVLPSFKGTEFNPPSFAFHAAPLSAILLTGLFGIVFTYLGGALALRKWSRSNIPDRWWICAKAAIIPAIVIQVIIMSAAGIYLLSRIDIASDESTSAIRLMEMLPAAGGIGYSLVYGADMLGDVESRMMGQSMHPISMKLNLYEGIRRNDGEHRTNKSVSGYAYILSALAAIAAVVSGRIAARWGSQDGSLPTAGRIAFIHILYLLVTMWLSWVGWHSAQGSVASKVFLGPRIDWLMVLSFIGVFVFSGIGAHFSKRCYVGPRSR